MADGCTTHPVGYVEGWYVDPDVRRKGVGKALVAAAEICFTRSRGIPPTKYFVWVTTLVPPALEDFSDVGPSSVKLPTGATSRTKSLQS